MKLKLSDFKDTYLRQILQLITFRGVTMATKLQKVPCKI